MPKVSIAAEPNVAVVRSADDVAPVGRSVIVHVHLPSDVHAPIDVGVRTSVYVRAPIDVGVRTSVYVRASMAATVVATTAVTPSMAPTVAFRIRRRNNSNSECRSNGKDERNLLQHFWFPPG
jgi:hypothetical protein